MIGTSTEELPSNLTAHMHVCVNVIDAGNPKSQHCRSSPSLGVAHPYLSKTPCCYVLMGRGTTVTAFRFGVDKFGCCGSWNEELKISEMRLGLFMALVTPLRYGKKS